MKSLEGSLREADGLNQKRGPLFIVWKGYQRRAETLCERLPADLVFMDHYFSSKGLRAVDYAVKALRTSWLLLTTPRSAVLLQAPPVFAALACIATRTPYILDVHNALFQSFWRKVPLTNYCVAKAHALIAHNSEAEKMLRETFPNSRIFVLSDPLSPIRDAQLKRKPKTLLLICSFDRDEPVDVMIEVIKALPDYQFFITANPSKLPHPQRAALEALPNLTLTGFLSISDYHKLLLTSAGAVVLTSMEGVQPSGACEALSSDTPLVVSRSVLTQELYGQWANVASNDTQSLVAAIRALPQHTLDLTAYRAQWGARVEAGLSELRSRLADVG